MTRGHMAGGLVALAVAGPACRMGARQPNSSTPADGSGQDAHPLCATDDDLVLVLDAVDTVDEEDFEQAAGAADEWSTYNCPE